MESGLLMYLRKKTTSCVGKNKIINAKMIDIFADDVIYYIVD